MADHDDLEFNPFYKCLQTSFREAFEYAQENCYLVCIPQAASLVGVQISQAFVETHLLKPSPMLQDHYISTDKGGTKTIILDDDIILTTEGFRHPGRTRVMSEELGYNKEYKPFKLLIIQKPLEGAVKGRRGSAGLSDQFLTPRIGYFENKKFLNLFPENRQHIASLDINIRQFNTTYMIVKGYLDAAAHKLRQMWEVSREAIIDNNHYVRLQSDSRLEDAISIAVESYIMGGVHSKVINAVTTQCAAGDRRLAQKVEELQGVTGEQLGLLEEFCCELPGAVVELARLDGINNPHEKLLCLKATLDNITTEVNTHTKNRSVPGSSASNTVLTSDELIPLLVMVISHAKCGHLASNLYYMEKFHWVKNKHDEKGYTLVTFKAAMEYMRNTDFSHIRTSQHKLKKEMSIEELMAASQNVYADGNNTPSDTERRRHPSGQADTSLQMKLENITRMMESTPLSSNSAAHGAGLQPIFSGFEENLERQNRGRAAPPPPDVIPITDQRSSRASQLGDFLSALQNDVLDGTYGKQE
ncbi:ankyrin repeat domain-containing protein 27-like [Amphiura filiformis]|uniref:ankyrin repeat domain-containing protein 27-like n=1 Tax=Amphiura filiformis TaxID=82378 RepID=UPI003B222655